MKVAKRLNEFEAYLGTAMNLILTRMKEEGKDVINLGLGDPAMLHHRNICARPLPMPAMTKNLTISIVPWVVLLVQPYNCNISFFLNFMVLEIISCLSSTDKAEASPVEPIINTALVPLVD